MQEFSVPQMRSLKIDAKILHAQGNTHGALELLEPIPINVNQIEKCSEKHKNALLAKTLLLTTNWIYESHQKQGEQVIDRYNAVVRLRDDWEKGYFCLAQYYDVLLQSIRGVDCKTRFRYKQCICSRVSA